MASPVRMTILRLLAEPKKNFDRQWSADPVAFGVCMSLIAEAIGVAQPTASRHLDILRQAGFITIRKQQKWSYCLRDDAAIEDYLMWVRNELMMDA